MLFWVWRCISVRSRLASRPWSAFRAKYTSVAIRGGRCLAQLCSQALCLCSSYLRPHSNRGSPSTRGPSAALGFPLVSASSSRGQTSGGLLFRSSSRCAVVIIRLPAAVPLRSLKGSDFSSQGATRLDCIHSCSTLTHRPLPPMPVDKVLFMPVRLAALVCCLAVTSLFAASGAIGWYYVWGESGLTGSQWSGF
jgi:hypothetical protein